MSDLSGASILITSTSDDNPTLQQRIEARAGRSICIPLVRIAPPEDAGAIGRLRRLRETLADFDWIALTSRHAARAVLGGVIRKPSHPRIAVVGETTGAETQALGWTADLVASGKGSEALARAMDRTGLKGAKVLYPCSNLAAETLVNLLRSSGANVEVAVTYQTLPPGEAERQDLLAHWEWINGAIFASPSAVKHFLAIEGTTKPGRGRSVGAPRDTWVAVAIGATTGGALEEAGFAHIAQAAHPDIDGLLETLVAAWQSRNGGNRA